MDHGPAAVLHDFTGGLPAAFQISLVLLVNVSMGAGGGLPAAHHLLRDLRGHIQIEHQVRLRQAQLAVFQLKEPVQKDRPFLRRQFGRLMDGVGRGVAVRDHQPAGLIESAPVLLVGGIAIHGKHQRRCVGVHIAGAPA